MTQCSAPAIPSLSVVCSEVPIEWTEMAMGFEAGQRTGHIITEDHLKAFEDQRVVFKGPLTIPPEAGASYVTIRNRRFTSANQVFRKVYNLYANIRPARSIAGVKTPFSGVDLVVMRENTEDLYTGEEQWVDPDTVEGIKRISRGATTRIAESAFQYAVANGRKRVTCVHKANVCKQADGLFLSTCKSVASKYPQIRFDDQLADSLLTKLVQNPKPYDVLLCPNLFGDLISDLGAGLIGSLGLCPSGQFGSSESRMAVFEPCHGSAPDIAGRGLANPVSQIRCAVMMLQHFNEHNAAARIERAIEAVLLDPANHPHDLGGTATTQQLTTKIIAHITKNK